MRKKIMCLFEGRHNMPDFVEGAVLHNIHDITDLKTMSEQCHESLQDCSELILYVTGLTPALTSVYNYCAYNHIPLTLMHYNRVTDSYFRQVVYVERKKKYTRQRELQMV